MIRLWALISWTVSLKHTDVLTGVLPRGKRMCGREGHRVLGLSVSLSRVAKISRILSHLLFLGSVNATSKKVCYSCVYNFVCIPVWAFMRFSSTIAIFSCVLKLIHNTFTMSNSRNASQDNADILVFYLKLCLNHNIIIQA